jgi:hypothetical protein
MKFARWAFALVFAVVLALLAADAIARGAYLYVTPETKSEFLKSFSAQDVLARFSDKRYNSHAAASADSSGGRKFVLQRADWQAFFVIKNEAMPSLARRSSMIFPRASSKRARR